jgi:hypothetical protein
MLPYGVNLPVRTVTNPLPVRAVFFNAGQSL